MSSHDRLLALELAAIDTNIAHRQMKAQLFLEMIEDDTLHPEIWKRLDANEDLMELERLARKAKANLKIEWNSFTDSQQAARMKAARDRRPWWAWLLPETKEASQ